MTSPAPAYMADDGGAGKIGAISVARFLCVLLSVLLLLTEFGGRGIDVSSIIGFRNVGTRPSASSTAPPLAPADVEIVISTYAGHKEQVRRFLASNEKFNKDFRDCPITLILSESDMPAFSELVDGFPASKPQIRLLCIDELMMRYFSWNPSTNILESFGRATFQSLKKLIGMLHARASVSLLLDSESYFVRPCGLKVLVAEFMAHPFVFMSREFDNDAQRRAISLANSILGAEGSAEGQAVSEELLGIIIAYQWIFPTTAVQDFFGKYRTKLVELMSKKRELFIEVVLYAYMRGEGAAAHNFTFVDMTETLQPIGKYEHVWMRFDASSITQVHALQSIYEAFPLFCYSIQSTGNVENNARVVLWEQSIKLLTSTPDLYSA
jgi:hypothetical protein